jgi:hypothetical protein
VERLCLDPWDALDRKNDHDHGAERKGGTLSISGERKAEQEEKDKKYHRVERSYGAFSRASRCQRARIGGKRQQRADHRIESRKEQFVEDRRGRGAIKEEIVPFDSRAEHVLTAVPIPQKLREIIIEDTLRGAPQAMTSSDFGAPALQALAEAQESILPEDIGMSGFHV